MESVTIKDCSSDIDYFFPCRRWLSVTSFDNQTKVNLKYNFNNKESKFSLQNFAKAFDNPLQWEGSKIDDFTILKSSEINQCGF